MNIALRLPDSLGLSLKEFAAKENVSMNQFIATAVAEKMSSLQTYDYLQERAKKGNLKHLQSILNRVPDSEPPKEDLL